jgi:hypothetical protein
LAIFERQKAKRGELLGRFFFFNSFVFGDKNDRRIERMTGQLERPESWNDWKRERLKAGTTVHSL